MKTPGHAPLDKYQTTSQRHTVRNDHIWMKYPDRWKCVLCGAETKETPPPLPTEEEWMPLRYERLTAEERNMSPPPASERV